MQLHAKLMICQRSKVGYCSTALRCKPKTKRQNKTTLGQRIMHHTYNDKFMHQREEAGSKTAVACKSSRQASNKTHIYQSITPHITNINMHKSQTHLTTSSASRRNRINISSSDCIICICCDFLFCFMLLLLLIFGLPLLLRCCWPLLLLLDPLLKVRRRRLMLVDNIDIACCILGLL